MRQDAERAAPPLMVAAVVPRSPRAPPVACLPMPTMELEPMEHRADAHLEYRCRRADAVSHAVRGSPIPHYADSPDAGFRTTAISEVT